jgi:hypothetical protein
MTQPVYEDKATGLRIVTYAGQGPGEQDMHTRVQVDAGNGPPLDLGRDQWLALCDAVRQLGRTPDSNVRAAPEHEPIVALLAERLNWYMMRRIGGPPTPAPTGTGVAVSMIRAAADLLDGGLGK